MGPGRSGSHKRTENTAGPAQQAPEDVTFRQSEHVKINLDAARSGNSSSTGTGTRPRAQGGHGEWGQGEQGRGASIVCQASSWALSPELWVRNVRSCRLPAPPPQPGWEPSGGGRLPGPEDRAHPGRNGKSVHREAEPARSRAPPAQDARGGCTAHLPTGAQGPESAGAQAAAQPSGPLLS